MSADGATPWIELRAVNCRRGDNAIVDASFVLWQGSLNILRGDGGASLLFGVATLLEIPDEGVMTLAGDAVREMDETTRASIRSRMFGFVFDAPYLLPELSVAENIAMPLFKVLDLDAETARDRTEEMLRFTGLASVATAQPSDLSWFDQQRVALARSIAHRPALLALKNADAHLSLEQSTELMRLARRVRSELSIGVLALCTHPITPDSDEHVHQVANGCVRLQTGVAISVSGEAT